MATVAFSPIHTWLSRPCSTHNLRPFSTSAPRSQVPSRAHTYPLCQSLPSDSFSAIHIEIPYTQNVPQSQAPRRTHNRRRSASLNDTPSAITPDQHANLLNDRPSIFNIATGQVLFSFLPRHSALFSLLPFTPRNEDDGIPAHDYTDNTPLPLVKLVAPLPPALTRLRTDKQSAPISPVGYKVISSLPRDIDSFNLDNPEMVSLRIIDPISTAECLLLLSICKELENLDVVVDRQESSPIGQVSHTRLRTLRVYASCGLAESFFRWLSFPGRSETDIFWDSRVSALEKAACASALQARSNILEERSF